MDEKGPSINPKEVIRHLMFCLPAGLPTYVGHTIVALWSYSDKSGRLDVQDLYMKVEFSGSVAYSQLAEVCLCSNSTVRYRMTEMKKLGLVSWRPFKFGIQFKVRYERVPTDGLPDSPQVGGVDNAQATHEPLTDYSQATQIVPKSLPRATHAPLTPAHGWASGSPTPSPRVGDSVFLSLSEEKSREESSTSHPLDEKTKTVGETPTTPLKQTQVKPVEIPDFVPRCRQHMFSDYGCENCLRREDYEEALAACEKR